MSSVPDWTLLVKDVIDTTPKEAFCLKWIHFHATQRKSEDEFREANSDWEFGTQKIQ
jgi:hypothetical protein